MKKSSTANKAAAPSPKEIPAAAFRRALLSWYDKNKRELPWRESTEPYRVLVSELMLQQTQVKTVLPYYASFLKKFPTAKKLAMAPEQEVLAAWAGLGYYRRARFLQAAAKAIAAQGFPQDEAGLLALPGIGGYTAAALGSICLGLPLAVVDGNVIRVLARVLALDEDAKSSRGFAAVKEAATSLLDASRPGDFNQAMMEIGALICSPRGPHCAACPLKKFCKAYRLGRQEDYPRLPQAAAATAVRKVAALVQKGGALLCAPRSLGGRMIGLWHFPEAEISQAAEPAAAASALAATALAKAPRALGPCGQVSHTVTRYRIRVEAYRFSSAAAAIAPWRWLEAAELKKMPLASAERQLLKLFEAALEMDSPLKLKP